MTIDEAIRRTEIVAEIKEKQIKNGDWEKDSLTERNCIKSAEEHRQLAEWFKDYKRLKEQPEITWVTGTDGAKVAFWDVPIPKVLKICEILQEPTVTSTKDNAEMTYPQVEGITPTVVLDETQDQLDFVQPHKRIPVTLSVSENPNNCDLISREEVCDYIAEFINHEYSTQSECEMVDSMIDGIQHMPPVKPQGKTGHWIVHPKGIYAHLICDKCLSNAPYDCRTDYCPSCGAKMVEPQERSE